MSSLWISMLRGGAFALCLAVMSCGGTDNSLSGGGSSTGAGTGGGTAPTGPNVASVTVSAGPAGVNALNTLYTSVTVCLPGSTTSCQTIDNIQVDTGSYGLRLLAQAVTLSLPVAQAPSGGGALLECIAFADVSYSWGPVALVDVQIGGESAASLPVQLIGDARYPTVPSGCASQGTAENTVAAFGANGLLGIGPFTYDCDTNCVGTVSSPIQYYACSTSTVCMGTAVPLSAQVQNPVSSFATDNNGSIISLPSVAETGATDVNGFLIFGIDTEANNMSGTQTVVPVSTSSQYITTDFMGHGLPDSFVDSGSNANYVNASLTACPNSGGSSAISFYCPTSPVTLSAAFVLANASTVSQSFVVADADTIAASVTAYPGLAGTNSDAMSFDWGLPFFYGRRVANAIEGASTSVGTGPYIAF